jgi:hypothetical protein
LPNSRRKLHRASIVYEFEQYRQKTVEYRTKIWLAIWMQKSRSAFHGLTPSVRFSFGCNFDRSVHRILIVVASQSGQYRISAPDLVLLRTVLA